MKLDVLNDKLSIDPQSVIKKLAPISLYKMKNTNLYSESNSIEKNTCILEYSFLNICISLYPFVLIGGIH